MICQPLSETPLFALAGGGPRVLPLVKVLRVGGLALCGTSKSTLCQIFGNLIEEVAERIKRPRIIEECFKTATCAHDTDITLSELTTCCKILCLLPFNMYMGGAHEALAFIEGLWEDNGCHRRAAIFLSDKATDKLFH